MFSSVIGGIEILTFTMPVTGGAAAFRKLNSFDLESSTGTLPHLRHSQAVLVRDREIGI